MGGKQLQVKKEKKGLVKCSFIKNGVSIVTFSSYIIKQLATKKLFYV